MDVYNKLINILMNEDKPSMQLEVLMNKEDFKESEFNILNKLKNIPQDKNFHPEGNVWNHTKLVIDTAAKIKGFAINTEAFMWAALFHDIGKIETTKFIKGRYRSYNHDKVGKSVTYKILIDYMDKERAEMIAEIVSFHMHHIYILKDLPFSDIPALIKSSSYNDIILLFICDKLGRGNQSIEEKEKALLEVNKILDKLCIENKLMNKDIMKKIQQIKEILI
ncbi:MAG: HD domain-containing protein [Clostridium sp.]|uniref:HD domain-containing protein n=1 Tax=Clostridium sp. TaxID=1506 RepID=UPI0025C6A4EC|nr:HD domain-containing protein [Clostridium sp.]MCF0148465.1 HD domain-containing protein [Clostridium sp.]